MTSASPEPQQPQPQPAASAAPKRTVPDTSDAESPAPQNVKRSRKGKNKEKVIRDMSEEELRDNNITDDAVIGMLHDG